MAHLEYSSDLRWCGTHVEGEYVRSAKSSNWLGCRDRAGVAVVLTAAIEILKRSFATSTADVLLSCTEEAACSCARHAELKIHWESEVGL